MKLKKTQADSCWVPQDFALVTFFSSRIHIHILLKQLIMQRTGMITFLLCVAVGGIAGRVLLVDPQDITTCVDDEDCSPSQYCKQNILVGTYFFPGVCFQRITSESRKTLEDDTTSMLTGDFQCADERGHRCAKGDKCCPYPALGKGTKCFTESCPPV